MRHLLPFTPIAAALLASSCGALAPPGTPLVVAHRSGAGHWPENSRTAVRGAVAAGYAGIEFDLVLTSDRVPVLSHDPSLNPRLCTHADGSALAWTDPVYIKDLTLQELHAGYRCGGLADPENPTAQVVADTHLTLDELIAEVAGHPDLLLHFDVKFEAEKTLDATTFADEILGRWDAAGFPNPWYMSCSQPEFIGVAAGRGARVSYTLPRPIGAGSTGNAVVGEVLGKLGVADQIGLARQSGAAGLNVAYQVVDRAVVDAARREGLTVQVWTLNDPALLDFYCRWPVDVLITDYPERSPCF